jgi:hypothetical protein
MSKFISFLTKVLPWAAGMSFVIGVVSYLTSDFSFEATYFSVSAIFLLFAYTTLRTYEKVYFD